MADKKSTTGEFTINGDQLVQKVKEIVREGNIRRIIIKDEHGKVLIEVPVTFAAVGALIAPPLAAIGALAALITKCTIVVEKKGDE